MPRIRATSQDPRLLSDVRILRLSGLSVRKSLAAVNLRRAERGLPPVSRATVDRLRRETKTA